MPSRLVFSLLLLAGSFVTPPVKAQSPVEFQVGAFTFLRPTEFAWVASNSPMRKAELSFAGADGTAEVTFFHFGAGQGGNPQANIKRWLGQFQEPVESLQASTASQTIGQTQVTLLSARGTFLSGMPGQPTTPMPGYALRGAILENSGGDVYVKMTGPQATVDAGAEAFDKMVLDAAARLAAPAQP